MKCATFQDAVESTTRLFGRKSDVRVVFQGGEAYTNGGTVVLPALPPSADITVDQANVIRGYRDHEAMHNRCTDMSPATQRRLANLAQTNKALHQLVQYCEDIRIEHAGVQEYAGMRNTFSATNVHAAKLNLEQLEQYGDPAAVIPSLPPILQFRIALQTMGRKNIGIEIGAYEQMAEHIKAHNPELHGLAEKFADEMAKLPTGYEKGGINEEKAKSYTELSFDLARRIYDAYGLSLIHI